LARQTEESAGSNSLPRPELNPLLNPLLAENMGRWAEIYYTNPPEKREAAVLQLLRELGGENPAGEAPTTNVPEAAHLVEERPPLSELQPELPEFFSLPVARPQAQTAAQACPRCGHQNPPDHSFCGECGERLSSRSTTQHGEFTPPSSVEHEPRQDFIPSESIKEELSPAHEHYAELDFGRPSVDAGVWPGSESVGSRQSAEDASQDLNSEAAQAPAARSYRVYIAVALAVVILVLVYMTWRSMKAAWQSHPLPAPPVTGEQTAKSAGPEGEAQGSKPGSSISLGEAQNRPAPQPSAISSSTAKAETGQPEPLQMASSASPVVNDSPIAPLPGPGSEELLEAQRLLNSTNGQPRDPAQAAQWLWKAIAKKNAEATLLLADLYLKGDGVPKNCDQARVLLDSATRKRVPGAADRLRNLQAFGCQ